MVTAELTITRSMDIRWLILTLKDFNQTRNQEPETILALNMSTEFHLLQTSVVSDTLKKMQENCK